MMNSKRYISNSTKPKTTKFGRVSLVAYTKCSFDHVMSNDNTKTLYFHFLKIYKYQIWHSGNLGWLAVTYHDLCSFGHVMSHDRIKTLWLYFLKTYKPQTWHSDNLAWAALTYQVPLFMWSPDVSSQNVNVISPLPLNL